MEHELLPDMTSLMQRGTNAQWRAFSNYSGWFIFPSISGSAARTAIADEILNDAYGAVRGCMRGVRASWAMSPGRQSYVGEPNKLEYLHLARVRAFSGAEALALMRIGMTRGKRDDYHFWLNYE